MVHADKNQHLMLRLKLRCLTLFPLSIKRHNKNDNSDIISGMPRYEKEEHNDLCVGIAILMFFFKQYATLSTYH